MHLGIKVDTLKVRMYDLHICARYVSSPASVAWYNEKYPSKIICISPDETNQQTFTLSPADFRFVNTNKTTINTAINPKKIPNSSAILVTLGL